MFWRWFINPANPVLINTVKGGRGVGGHLPRRVLTAPLRGLDVCKCRRYLRRRVDADMPKYLEKVLWLASLVSAALGLLGVVELVQGLALGLILGAAGELLGD